MTHAILAHVVVADGRSDTEQRKLHDTKGSQSLGKILWLLHLSDEGWVQDLQKKKVSVLSNTSNRSYTHVTNPKEDDAG